MGVRFVKAVMSKSSCLVVSAAILVWGGCTPLPLGERLPKVALPLCPNTWLVARVMSLKGTQVYETDASDKVTKDKYLALLAKAGWKVTNTLGECTNVEKDGVFVPITIGQSTIQIDRPAYLQNRKKLELPVPPDFRTMFLPPVASDTWSFTTKRPGAVVFGDYKQLLRKSGWLIANETEFPEAGGTLMASRSGQSYHVTIQGMGSEVDTIVNMCVNKQRDSGDPESSPDEPGAFIAHADSNEAIDRFKKDYEKEGWSVLDKAGFWEAVKADDYIVVSQETDAPSVPGAEISPDTRKSSSFKYVVFDPDYKVRSKKREVKIPWQVKQATHQAYLASLPPFEKTAKKKPDVALPADFDACFDDGHVFKAVSREEFVQNGICTVHEPEVTIRVEKTALIRLPSGSVIGCDPYCIAESEAFNRSVKPGIYQGFISHEEHGRPMAAKISFGSGKVVKWEMAMCPSWVKASANASQRFGYGVDGGIGCFVDATAKDLLTKQKALVLSKQLARGFFEGSKRGERTREWVSIPLGSTSNSPNVLAVESGPGDGSYASWWGLDVQGNPVCLVTDFDMLHETASVSIELEIADFVGQYLSHPLFDRFNRRIRVTPGPIAGRSLHFESEDLPSIDFMDKNGAYPPTTREQINRRDGVYSEVFIFENKIDSSLRARLNFCMCQAPRR